MTGSISLESDPVTEKSFAGQEKRHVKMHKFNLDGLAEVIEKLQGKPVYITLDLDVLDPSVFPGTGTPEAGGVTFVELMNAVIQTAQESTWSDVM